MSAPWIPPAQERVSEVLATIRRSELVIFGTRSMGFRWVWRVLVRGVGADLFAVRGVFEGADDL